MAKRFSKIAILLLLVLALLVPMMVMSVGAEEGTWTLVTNVADLSAGDKVVIVANDYDYAMSTTQNNNNRGKVAVTKGTGTVTFTTNVQVITLEAGTTSGTFAFNVGNGYLCAASSSSNYLRTKTTIDANSSWEIDISNTGVATVRSTGSYTRNLLKYNNGSNIFSAYGSGQQDICIYKFVPSGSGGTVCEHTNTTTETANATCTTAGSTTVTCDDCEKILSTETIPATGHNYVDGVCTKCSAEEPKGLVDPGEYYILSKRDSDQYYKIMTNDLGTSSTTRYQSANSTYSTDSSLPEVITGPNSQYVFTFEKTDGGYYISCDGKYIDWESGNSGTFADNKTDAQVVTITLGESSGSFNIKLKSDETRVLSLNTSNGS